MMIRLLYQFPSMWQRMMSSIHWRIKSERKTVYLTFDDGPIPQVTPKVLDILRKYGVKATFFMVADNARRYPTLYRQVRDEGHHIGNHTFHHIKALGLSTDNYLADIDLAADVLDHTPLFRPPYGRTWAWQRRAIREKGYHICLWDVLTHDYNAAYTEQKMMRIVMRYTRPGSIITFHDSVKSNERMLAVLPQVIEYLLSQGYEIRPIPYDLEEK